jgi:DNA replication protein
LTAAPQFAGFPARPRSTAIPDVFFTDVLPRLTDPASLGVTLFALRVLSRKKGYPRYLTPDDLCAEPALAEFLAAAGADDTAVDDGLRGAAGLGVLLSLRVADATGERELYFLNAPADRRALEAVRAGEVDVGARVVPAPPSPGRPRGIFALYESVVGTVSPALAEELAEAERLYPAEWLEGAFREAAAQNARSWRYVSRILERWSNEGPDYAKAGGDPAVEGRYFEGKYGRILRGRLER